MAKRSSLRQQNLSGGRRPSPDPLIGALLGSYRVMARLAEGGMGVIYRAEHVRLPRQVAIKVLKPELARFPALVERLVEEARAVNQVRHPNLVDIIDVAEGPGPGPDARMVYLVMELLEGTDLGRRLRETGALDPLEAVEIADAVADALIAVHEQHILHRDVKAENVFLARRPDGSTSVKLLDFGIATTFGGRDSRKLTSPGARVGTPDCMALEQVSGEPLDERTDIYALGLILYHMLSGTPAFHSTSINEVLSNQLHAKPPPIRRRGVRSRDAVIPPALERVVMQCLEKKREDRFSDVRALRDAMWAALGVPDGRLYLRPTQQRRVNLAEAPTFTPGRLAKALPAAARRVSRGRWLATGALAGVAVPLLAILFRGPITGVGARTCEPLAAELAPRPRRTDAQKVVAVRATERPGLPAPQLEPRMRRQSTSSWLRVRALPATSTGQDRPAVRPAGGKIEAPRPPKEQNLDRTVDPFTLEKAPRPASPVAVRDGA